MILWRYFYYMPFLTCLKRQGDVAFERQGDVAFEDRGTLLLSSQDKSNVPLSYKLFYLGIKIEKAGNFPAGDGPGSD